MKKTFNTTTILVNGNEIGKVAVSIRDDISQNLVKFNQQETTYDDAIMQELVPKTILDKHIGHKNNKLKIPIIRNKHGQFNISIPGFLIKPFCDFMALFYKDTQLNKNQIAHKYRYYWRTIRSRQAIWLFLGIGFISIGLLISALGAINHNLSAGLPLIYLGITLFILIYTSKKFQQHTNANKAKEEQERLESPIDDFLLANLIIPLAVRNSSSHNGKAPSIIKVAKNFSRKEFERIKTTFTKDLKQKLDQSLKPNKSSNYTAIELQKAQRVSQEARTKLETQYGIKFTSDELSNIDNSPEDKKLAKFLSPLILFYSSSGLVLHFLTKLSVISSTVFNLFDIGPVNYIFTIILVVAWVIYQKNNLKDYKIHELKKRKINEYCLSESNITDENNILNEIKNLNNSKISDGYFEVYIETDKTNQIISNEKYTLQHTKDVDKFIQILNKYDITDPDLAKILQKKDADLIRKAFAKSDDSLKIKLIHNIHEAKTLTNLLKEECKVVHKKFIFQKIENLTELLNIEMSAASSRNKQDNGLIDAFFESHNIEAIKEKFKYQWEKIVINDLKGKLAKLTIDRLKILCKSKPNPLPITELAQSHQIKDRPYNIKPKLRKKIQDYISLENRTQFSENEMSQIIRDLYAKNQLDLAKEISKIKNPRLGISFSK